MSYVATGFWLGVTAGRLVLGFPAARYGEKRMVLIYTFIALCIQFIFWCVPNIPVSAVSVALIGFFIGPIFPCAVALATKVLPGYLHVSVIGFIAAFGTIPVEWWGLSV
jgi:fucose permease